MTPLLLPPDVPLGQLTAAPWSFASDYAAHPAEIHDAGGGVKILADGSSNSDYGSHRVLDLSTASYLALGIIAATPNDATGGHDLSIYLNDSTGAQVAAMVLEMGNIADHFVATIVAGEASSIGTLTGWPASTPNELLLTYDNSIMRLMLNGTQIATLDASSNVRPLISANRDLTIVMQHGNGGVPKWTAGTLTLLTR